MSEKIGDQLRTKGLSEHDVEAVEVFVDELRARKLERLTGALYRIAQGVERPADAAREALVANHLPTP